MVTYLCSTQQHSTPATTANTRSTAETTPTATHWPLLTDDGKVVNGWEEVVTGSVAGVVVSVGVTGSVAGVVVSVGVTGSVAGVVVSVGVTGSVAGVVVSVGVTCSVVGVVVSVGLRETVALVKNEDCVKEKEEDEGWPVTRVVEGVELVVLIIEIMCSLVLIVEMYSLVEEG